ncbi:MAG TPA: branched-chain amino acid ABC transporter permease [Aggregatilineales bacterium]|nr:branched-chain amino acid ABC transporter permease [Aggregatilineales bacterium]
MITNIRTWWSKLPNAAQITLVAALVILFPFVIDIAESAIRAAGGNLALLTQVNRALIYVVLALGLNIVVGFAGMLDLGYAAFFAIGAYAFGILTYPSHGIQMSFFLALWVCAAIASFFGIVVGSPTLRLRGDYLAIVTLAFGEIIPTVVRNLDDLTNGSQGLTPIGKPSFGVFEGLFGLEPGTLNVGVDPHFWFYVIALLVALVLFCTLRLDNSRIGRAWKAIREDQTAADFMGVDPIRAKLSAFAIGASFSGLAGVVFASMLGAIFPDLFRFQVSIFLLIIVVFSGLGSVWGVLIGGLIISLFDGLFLAQILNQVLPSGSENLRWVFFGIGLIFFMIFRPQGLFPRKVKGRVLTEEEALAANATASTAAKGGD